jgi:hypothetical protein
MPLLLGYFLGDPVQRALHAKSAGHDFRSGSSASATRVSKFLIAGVAAAGAAAIAVNPLAPTVSADVPHNVAADVQHPAVRLTSAIGDVLGAYEGVISQANANLQTLGGEAGDAIPGLVRAIGANLSGYADLINTGLTGAGTGVHNALYGGWYGGDDGYVFGLFGGSVTHLGVTQSGSTLQEIFGALQQGNIFNAFSYYEEWTLEAIDHTLKPLLSPILNTAKAGATPTATIPGEILQTLTNVANLIFTYGNLKSVGDAMLSPALSVTFGLVDDLTKIGADVSSANIGAALTDVLKAPADLAGDLLNGYVYQGTYNPTGVPFTGLLNSGSLLQSVLQTWPNLLAKALGATTTAAPATAQVASTKVAPAAATVTLDVAAEGSAAGAATKTKHAGAAASSSHRGAHSHAVLAAKKHAGGGHSHSAHAGGS